MSFEPGDKVLVNGGVVAEVDYYNEDTNIVRYTVKDGNGINTVTGHVTHTRLEHYPARLQPEADALDEAKADLVNAPGDQLPEESAIKGAARTGNTAALAKARAAKAAKAAAEQ